MSKIDSKLVALNNWGVVRSTEGNPKVPVQSNRFAYKLNQLTADLRMFSINDAWAWMQHSQAQIDIGTSYNIAFGMVKEDRLLCIDVDVYALDGKTRIDHQELLKKMAIECGTYWELSVSRKGLHMWYEVPAGFELPNGLSAAKFQHMSDWGGINCIIKFDFLYHSHYVVIPHDSARGGSIVPLSSIGKGIVECLELEYSNKVALAELPAQIEPDIDEMQAAIASAKMSAHWNRIEGEDGSNSDWALLGWISKQVRCNVEACLRIFKLSPRYTPERAIEKKRTSAQYDLYLQKSAIRACQKAHAEILQRDSAPKPSMSLPPPPPQRPVPKVSVSPVMASAPVAPPGQQVQAVEDDLPKVTFSLSLPGKQAASAPVGLSLPEPEAKQYPLSNLPPEPETLEYPLDAFPEWMRNGAIEIAKRARSPLAIAGHAVLGAVGDIVMTRFNTWSEQNMSTGQPTALFLLTRAGSGMGKSSCDALAGAVQDRHEMERNAGWEEVCKMLVAQHEAKPGKPAKPKIPTTFALGQPGESQHYEEEEPAEPREQFALQIDHLGNLRLPASPLTNLSDFSMEAMIGALIRGQACQRVKVDEASLLFGGAAINEKNAATALGMLTKLWDCGEANRLRAKSNQEGSGRVYDRRVSITASGQPVILDKYICDDVMNGQGFMARVILACPPSNIGNRQRDVSELLGRVDFTEVEAGRVYTAETEKLYAIKEHIVGLDDFDGNSLNIGRVLPPVVKLNNEAISAYVDYCNRLDIESKPLEKYCSTTEHAGRGAQVALRVATVFAIAEGLTEVTADVFNRASKVIDYSLSCKIGILGQGVSPQEEDDAATLYAWLLEEKRIDKWRNFSTSDAARGLSAGLRGKSNKAKREKLLERLVLEGKLLFNNRNYSLVV